jgi:hypothetical protein
MRLTTAITAATAAAVILAIAAPGAGAMVNSGGGGTPYSQTSTTRSHGLVSGVGGLGNVRGHTAAFRGCPRVGPCISPYRLVIDGSGSVAAHQTTATSQQAFQWGDAGIGAVAILLLLGAGGGAAVATRRQRHGVTAG